MIYAEISNGICVNTVVADESFARMMKLVELPDGYGIGDYYANGIWSHDPIEPTPTPPSEGISYAEMAAAIREGVNSI